MAYLYRAINSIGNTIDFQLSPKRDFIAAETFLQLALLQTAGRSPTVINVGWTATQHTRQQSII